MSELALRLIEEEKRAKTGKLDLGCCGLTAWPEELFDLLWLQELRLSNAYWDVEQREWIESANDGYFNRLQVIPPAIAQLKQLKILYCGGEWKSNWKIQDISVLHSLSHLQELNLDGNQIKEISVLEELTQLRSLSLSRNKLTNITVLKHLRQLQALYLENNPIRRLDGLRNLTRLTVLHLDCNRSKTYSFLKKLTGLQVLSLSHITAKDILFLQQLTKLEFLSLSWSGKKRRRNFLVFGQFTKLRVLHLSNTRIKDTHFLLHLSNLQSLTVEQSNFSHLSILQYHTGLQHLSLINNQIRDISILGHLTNLQTLFLDHNLIKNISALQSLSQLRVLSLSHNRLVKISHFTLSHLQELNLEHNQIKEISLRENLSQLRTLNLKDNQIKDLSGLLPLIELGHMPIRLRPDEFKGKINLSNNPLKHPALEIVQKPHPAVIDYLEGLNINTIISGKRLKLPLILIEKEKQAKTGRLDLAGCGLRELPQALFDLLWLEELNLVDQYWDHEKEEWVVSQNQGKANCIKWLPPEIGNLKKLKALRLSLTKDGVIEDQSSLSDLRELEELELFGSRYLRNISFLSELCSLRILNLSSSHIEDISYLKNLSQLRVLNLQDNRIEEVLYLGCLSELRQLNLMNNQIKDLSGLLPLIKLGHMPISLHPDDVKGKINLSNNPIEHPRLEIVRQGPQAIIDYFESIKLYRRNREVIIYGEHNLIKLPLILIEKERQEKTGKLDLGSCELSELPEPLFDLVWLEELNLKSKYWDHEDRKWVVSQNQGQLNEIYWLPPEISQLKKLKSFRLSIPDYGDMSGISSLQYLTELETLELSDSQQVFDLSFLRALGNLQLLGLGNNKIEDLSPLKSLRKLRILDLSGNSLDYRANFSCFENFADLQILDLADNKIEDISFLKNVRPLRSLDLNDNEIADISVLQGLTNLQTLELRSNIIEDMSPLLPFIKARQMQVSLAWGEGKINLYGNPLLHPPKEIVEQGNQAIIDYFERLSSPSLAQEPPPVVKQINDRPNKGSNTTPLARQLIEKEKQAKTGKLDLGCCGLTAWPEELFDLLWLEELRLSNAYWDDEQEKWIESANDGDFNYLEAIPPAIAELKQLKTLYCGGESQSNWKIQDISVLHSLSHLEHLNLCGNNIQDITALPHCRKLHTLILSRNNIQDISPLKGLTELQVLRLSANNIYNITSLKHLNKLQVLDLGFNKIRNISALAELTQLNLLDLGGNHIVNYSFLQNLTSLQVLSFYHLDIDNISFLQNLINLQSLYLHWWSTGEDETLPSRDFSILKNLTNLQSLIISSSGIASLSFLKHLKQMKHLNLGGTDISDISVLQHLTGLQSLSLSGNKIQQIEALRNLKNLQTLHLGYNVIEDISPLQQLTELQNLHLNCSHIIRTHFLQGLTKLKVLDLGSNLIQDTSFLKNLTQLQELKLEYNKIEDISSLKHLIQLRTLQLRRNQIQDISPLKNLSQLRLLNLRNNQLQEVSSLGNLSQLEELNLQENQVRDISGLENLTQLRELNLQENQIQDISGLLPLIELGNMPISLRLIIFSPKYQISLHDNPIQHPPLEIAKQGSQAIIDYLHALKEESP